MIVACGNFELRPYQLLAIQRLEDLMRRGVRRVVLVLPTGGGKTSIAVAFILARIAEGQRVLFLAHRRELINQAYQRLIDAGLPEDQVGVIMAADPRSRVGAPVQVASVDTLRHRGKPRADVVFIDECHRSTSNGYQLILETYRGALHVGLTATPFRLDGKGLGRMYDELVVVATPKQLIAEGFLVEPRVFTIPESMRADLSHVGVSAGDYKLNELAAAMDRNSLVGNLVDHWLKLAEDRRTICFAVTVAHSKHIVERFTEAGVAAEHLDANTPTHDRDAILQRLRDGATRVVSNVNVLCEGTDIPAAKCAILARPTMSAGLYLQQVGRILRPWQGQSALILDHAGCALQHGLPQDDREFSLEDRKRKKQLQSAPTKVCPDCYAVASLSARQCECGFVFFQDRELIEEKAATLVEYAPVAAVSRPPRPARATFSRPAAERRMSRSEFRELTEKLRRLRVESGRYVDWDDLARPGGSDAVDPFS